MLNVLLIVSTYTDPNCMLRANYYYASTCINGYYILGFTGITASYIPDSDWPQLRGLAIERGPESFSLNVLGEDVIVFCRV